jgi:hypothetical protein
MNDTQGTRISRLVNDPNLSGDLLLIGVVLATNNDFAGGSSLKVSALAKAAWPKLPPSDAMYKAKDALKSDIRRYRTPDTAGRPTCGSPTPRKEACGRNHSMFGYATDWDTGEQTLIAACSRHSDWFRVLLDTNRAARPETVPLAAANSGGDLARHFTEVDWPKLWALLDPRWVRHPEARPWPKPKLSLVLGNGDDGDDKPALDRRPALVPGHPDDNKGDAKVVRSPRASASPPRAANLLQQTPARLRYLESVASGSVLASPCEVHGPEGSGTMWYVTDAAGTTTAKWLCHSDVRPLWTPIERTFTKGPNGERVIRLTAQGQRVLTTWRGQA